MQRFLRDVMHRNPGDNDLLRRMSIIDENGAESRCAWHIWRLSAAIASTACRIPIPIIMRQTLFRDFDALWPGRIISLTNGISQRRWLADANPALTALISSRVSARIGSTISTGCTSLKPFARDEAFRADSRP